MVLMSCTPQPVQRSKKPQHIRKVNTFFPANVIGGFGIDTPQRAMKAAADGIQVVFKYGEPPTLSDSLGQALNSLHLKVVDAMPWTYLHQYECHRLKNLASPSVYASYCTADYPGMASENALFAALTAHLQQVKANQLIIGFWILDDWIREAGDAKQILIDMHTLIQKYMPGRPSICGFGGSIGLYQDYRWADWDADNFSPQGCDMVAFYIYTSSITNVESSPDAFNWSMERLLPAMFTSLQQRGWDIEEEPLIGIGQAFGGPLDRYYVTPNAKDIVIQSASFCKYGATGLVFYAWDNSGFGPTNQTPMNSPEIEMGIRSGISACKSIWLS